MEKARRQASSAGDLVERFRKLRLVDWKLMQKGVLPVADAMLTLDVLSAEFEIDSWDVEKVRTGILSASLCDG